jgi:hypothetical protein
VSGNKATLTAQDLFGTGRLPINPAMGTILKIRVNEVAAIR